MIYGIPLSDDERNYGYLFDFQVQQVLVSDNCIRADGMSIAIGLDSSVVLPPD